MSATVNVTSLWVSGQVIVACGTVGGLVSAVSDGRVMDDLKVRVNGVKVVDSDYRLNDGDRVTVTPSKIKGF